MKRYHDEKNIIERRYREYLRVTYLTEEQAGPKGRMRKRKPFDCGISRCTCCHGEIKFPKRIPTRKERMNELQDREG